MSGPVGEKEPLPEEERKQAETPAIPSASGNEPAAELWMGEAGQNGGMAPFVTAKPTVVPQLPDIPGLPEKVVPVAPYPFGAPEIRPPTPPYDERAAAEEQRRRRKMSEAAYERAVAFARAAGVMELDNARGDLTDAMVRKFREYNFPVNVSMVHERFEDFYAYYQKLLNEEVAGRQVRENEAQLRAIDEDSRAFGVAPQVLAPGFKPLVERDAAERKALNDYLTDQENANLTPSERAGNYAGRNDQTKKLGIALDHLTRLEGMLGKIDGIRRKILNGEVLTPGERTIWERRHETEEGVEKTTGFVLADLRAAKAILDKLPRSTALRKLDEAKSVGEFFGVLNTNAEEIIRIGADEVVSDFLVQKLGRVAAGPLGAILLSAFAAYGSALPAAVVEAFERRNIDLDDHEAVLDVIRNRKEMDAIYSEARNVSGIDALVAAVGVGAGETRLKFVRQYLGKMGVSLGGSLVQGAVAAGGEVLKHYAVGEESSLTGGRLGRSFIDGIIADRAAKALSGVVGAAAGSGSGARPGQSGGGPAGPRQAGGKATAPVQSGGGATPTGQAGGSVVRLQKQQSPGRDPKRNEPADENQRIARFDQMAKQAGTAAQALMQAIDASGAVEGAIQAMRSYRGPETLHLTWAAADRLRKAGVLTDAVAARLGIPRKWLDTVNATSDVAIQATVLLAAGLTRVQFGELAQNVRAMPDGLSAYEADAYRSERNAQLREISDFFQKPNSNRFDGWAAYTYVFELAKRIMSIEEAHRKTAEVIEYFANRALAHGNTTINDIFFKEYRSESFGLNYQ